MAGTPRCLIAAMLLWQEPLTGSLVELAAGGLTGLAIALNVGAVSEHRRLRGG